MSRSGAQIRESANQSKFIQQRISNVEKHFGELCQTTAAYTRRSSKLANSGDDMARALMAYAENESFNHTTKSALKEFAENFSGVHDFREAEVKRLEAKVIGPLTEYGKECKHARDQLKHAFSTRDKELKGKKNLDKVRVKNPTNRHTISEAETELQRASVDASRASLHLEQEMESFEKKKLTDIKKILVDFVNVEMVFHAKALETLTQCFQSVSVMDQEEDLEEFRNSLRPPSAQARLDSMKGGSRSSLNTTGASDRYPPSPARSTPATTPSGVRKGGQQHHRPPSPEDTPMSTNRSSMYSDGQEDDEEYEDDSEEDDDMYAAQSHNVRR